MSKVKRFTRIARQTLRRPKWKFSGWQQKLIFIFIGMMVALVALDFYLQSRSEDSKAYPAIKLKTLTAEERFRLEMDRVLLAAGVAPAAIEEQKPLRRVRVPPGVEMDDLYRTITARARQLGAETANIRNLPGGEKEFVCMVSGVAVDAFRLSPPAPLGQRSGKIALVIDDFGYHDDDVVKRFLALPFAITYAIIPGLPHSTALARKLQQAGKAVIVHMPMEALERRVEQNGYELLVESSPAEIRSRVRKAMAAIPGAQGMNNHMGSRATQNEALLSAAFSELKKSGFFFLDSRTTPETRAFELAQKQGLAAGLNDTFLDTVVDEKYVRQKLFYLAEVAGARGAAIGIGHPHRVTLQVLQEAVPQLQRRGFEMVPVETLLRQPALATSLQ